MKLTAITCDNEKLKEQMQYPLKSWKEDKGDWQIFDKSSLLSHVGDDPLFDISEVYYFLATEDGEGHYWTLLASAGSGYYIYIAARCDINGFEGYASGEIALALSFEDIWTDVVDTSTRKKIAEAQKWEAFS